MCSVVASKFLTAIYPCSKRPRQNESYAVIKQFQALQSAHEPFPRLDPADPQFSTAPCCQLANSPMPRE